MNNNKYKNLEAVVIGVSAGGLQLLGKLLERLPPEFRLPLIVVQHRAPESSEQLEQVLQARCRLRVKQADEKEPILGGTAYFAPPDYHLLVETDRTFSLSYDPPVNFSRPSIDVLFETAAATYDSRLVAIILTGASNDGTEGIRQVKSRGGLTIAQNPETAPYPYMPQSAINSGEVMQVLDPEQIGNFLLDL
ncbi:chemotaxis protein CheB [Paraflavisolibacter sp. H34]|uniref:chemotaxis protein CheB n=1 Tax=Huijunlia imazamoxiresistens TaxID=3127457 RepID=UPI00301659EC